MPSRNARNARNARSAASVAFLESSTMSSSYVWCQISDTFNLCEPVSHWVPAAYNGTADYGFDSSDQTLDPLVISTNPLNGFLYPSHYSWTQIAVVSVLVTTIMLIIVLGNGLVVLAIAVDRKLKSLQNWFIASLAVSDLFVGLFIMPLSLTNELLGYWAFGDVLCELWLSTDVLLCTASILNLCLISLDRYWSITRAVSYVRQRTKRRALIMISVVWILSMAICFPPLAGWKRPQPTKLSYPLCVLSEEPGYVLYSIVGSFYLPLAVMVSVYLKIYMAARTRARRNLAKNDQTTPRKFSQMRLESTLSQRNDDTGVLENSITIEPIQKLHSAHYGIGEQHTREGVCLEGGSSTLSVESSKPKGDCFEMTFPTNQCTSDQSKQPIALVIEETSFHIDLTKLRSPKSSAKNLPRQESDSVESEVSSHSYEPQENTPKKESHTIDYTRITTGMACDLLRGSPANSVKHNGWRTPPSRQASHLSDSIGLSSADERTTLVPLLQVSAEKEFLTSGRFSVNRQYLKRYLKYSPPISGAQEASKAKRKLARARERRATLVLGIVMASFIGCWLPFFSIYPITSLTGLHVPPEVFGVIFWLGYCNSALNPIIYTIFNREFRQAFHRILFRRLPQKSWV